MHLGFFMKQFWSDEKCKCGCGEPLGLISKSTHYRMKNGIKSAGWIRGHSSKGERNVNWNNRRATSAQGYAMVWAPNHPNARQGGWILEHRLAMSNKIGRPLLETEIVHHVDENKLNNDPDNLEIMTRSNHHAEHDPNAYRRKKRIPKVCVACGISFIKEQACNHNRSKFCSKACRNAAGPQHPRRKADLPL